MAIFFEATHQVYDALRGKAPMGDCYGSQRPSFHANALKKVQFWQKFYASPWQRRRGWLDTRIN